MVVFGGFFIGCEVVWVMLLWQCGMIIFIGVIVLLCGCVYFVVFFGVKFVLCVLVQSMVCELGLKGIYVVYLIIDGVIDIDFICEILFELYKCKEQDGIFDFEYIVEIYWQIYCQLCDCWVYELDLCFWMEIF